MKHYHEITNSNILPTYLQENTFMPFFEMNSMSTLHCKRMMQ